MTARWFCEECLRTCDNCEVLTAPDPFTLDGTLVACPHCRTAENLVSACDEPKCAKRADAGTPTPDGYRQTCHNHIPKAPR